VIFACIYLQDVSLLHHMQKSDQKTPVFFVKMSADFQRPSGETSVCELPSCCYESASPSSPRLLKQLVDLEFFRDDGGLLSDDPTTRPPSEVEQILGNTLVPAPSEEHADRADETPIFFTPDSSYNPTNSDRRSPVLFPINELTEPCNRTADFRSLVADEAQSIVDACGSSPTEFGGAVSEIDRPTSTLSSAVSFERSCSDIDSETYPLMAESELIDGLTDGFCGALASFAGSILHSRLLSTVALMNTIHRRCLETMISVAFDMAWDVICTPTRIKFARTKEVNNTTFVYCAMHGGGFRFFQLLVEACLFQL